MSKEKFIPNVLYECPVCGDLFDTKSECREHGKEHDNEKRLRIVALDLCNGRWELQVRQMRRVKKDTPVGNRVIRVPHNFWYIEVDDDAKHIRSAQRRLKAAGLRWLRRQVKLVEKLDANELNEEELE